MKGLVTLGVIGLIAAGASMFVIKKMNEDPGQMVAIAFGKPADGDIEVHAVVMMGNVNADPVRRDEVSGYEYWDEWLEQHWNLRGSNGQRVPLQRTQYSSLIDSTKAGSTYEFFLIGKVRQGDNCTFDYVPRYHEPARYRYEFTAPTDESPMKRYTFKPVEGD